MLEMRARMENGTTQDRVGSLLPFMNDLLRRYEHDTGFVIVLREVSHHPPHTSLTLLSTSPASFSMDSFGTSWLPLFLRQVYTRSMSMVCEAPPEVQVSSSCLVSRLMRGGG